MKEVGKTPSTSVSDAIESVRAGRLNEALRMLSRGDIDQMELEETLRVYHAELHIQNDELRQSQRRIEQSQQRFMRLFDSQPAPVMVLDSQGVIRTVNRASRERFGLSDRQIQGRFFVRMVVPEDQALYVDMLDSLSRVQETELVEMVLETDEGRFPSLVRMARHDLVSDGTDSSDGYEVIVHLVDITRIREKEHQVSAQKELLSRVSREIPGALMHYRVWGPDVMRYEYLSPGMEQLTGQPVAALLDDVQLIFDTMHPQDRTRMQQVLAQMHAHPREWQDQFRVWSEPHNDWRWLEFKVHPKVIDESESEWFGYVEDITESRQATRLLISHARRAAMGDMLSHITHQWKQPLNALELSVANLEDAQAMGGLNADTVQQHASTAHRLIEQMAQTISDFVQFYQPNRANETFSPKMVIDRALELIAVPLRQHQIAVEVQYSDAEMAVEGQPNELIQVVLILLQNAVQVLEQRQVEQPSIRVRLNPSPNQGAVQLQVVDNGGGVASEHMGQLFEAYFTTRESGSGIGLYLARLIIESTFGGTIECHSQAPETVMTIRLPMRQAVVDESGS